MAKKAPHPADSDWDITQIGEIDVLQLATEPIYGNTPFFWILAPLVVLATYMALRLFFRLFSRIAKRQKRGSWLAFILLAFTRTHKIPAFLVALYIGGVILTLPKEVMFFLTLAAHAGILVQFALWLTGAIESWATRSRARYLAKNPAAVTSLEIARIALHGLVWLAAGLMFLDGAGFNITTLVAGLGIGGIAVALAVQNLLGDLLASVSIAMDKPFVVGDFLVIGTEKGTVEAIGLKTTRLRSVSGEQIVLSNADLLASRIQNFGRMQERRVQVILSLTYDTPRQALEDIPNALQSAVETQGTNVRFDRAHFVRYGACALEFEYVYFVTSPDYKLYMDVQQAINFAIHKAFEEAHIQFAFPTQTLYLRRKEEIT